jgi:hypothetical protein
VETKPLSEKAPQAIFPITQGARIRFHNMLWLTAEKRNFYPTVLLSGHDTDDEVVIVRQLYADACFKGEYIEAAGADVPS